MPDEPPTFHEQLAEVLADLPPETLKALAAQELLSHQIARQLSLLYRVRSVLIWLLAGNTAMVIVNAAMLWRMH